MGTNYYFTLKKQKHQELYQMLNILLNKNLQSILLTEVNSLLNKEIHIGKTSLSFRPLFQKTDYFKSIKELKAFYEKNKNDLDIINEYNTALTWQEFEELVISKQDGRFNEDYGYYFDEDGYWFYTKEFE